MAGIYFHIPFCKKKCSYCDFHFSTSLKKKGELMGAMTKELYLRKEELKGQVETVYFGGGTPSLLDLEELKAILDEVGRHFQLAKDLEVTLEANPDDLDREKLAQLKSVGVNRLSVGIQSFFEEDLVFMNRAHNSRQAEEALKLSCELFENVSIDLIYGIPGMDRQRWQENLERAFSYPIKHLSSYALTVEPKTALHHRIATGKCRPLSEEKASLHFDQLVTEAEKRGFLHYEVSNFGKEHWLSRHNTSYWKGTPYLGIGPSAHSYDGVHRSWNVANNALYIRSLTQGVLPMEKEMLEPADRANELIMTGLRTMWGVSLADLEKQLDLGDMEKFTRNLNKYLDQGLLKLESGFVRVEKKGLFLVDGIAADLFIVRE